MSHPYRGGELRCLQSFIKIIVHQIWHQALTSPFQSHSACEAIYNIRALFFMASLTCCCCFLMGCFFLLGSFVQLYLCDGFHTVCYFVFKVFLLKDILTYAHVRTAQGSKAILCFL